MTEPSMAPGRSEPLDLSRVLAEIEEEARLIKASGRIAPGYEAKVASAFEEMVPGGVSSTELARALRSLDEASVIRGDIPVEEQSSAIRFGKRLLRKSMAWYMRFLAGQVGAMGQANLRIIRLLVERIEELERRVPPGLPRQVGLLDEEESFPDLSAWAGIVVSRMAGSGGRILHAEAGRGQLLDEMCNAGLDAYGVEPVQAAADRLVSRGLDVWADDPAFHIERVGYGSLGGVVLSGMVDRESPTRIFRILVETRERLRPGCSLVVLATSPKTPIVSARVELSDGKAMHARAWKALLSAAGFEEVEELTAPSGSPVVGVAGVRGT